MNTPDAGRIRVRWYRVPDSAPGSYPLTDYSSSNFDADTYSYDPDIGEESSSRTPFADWRDCCAPPWFGYRDDLCPDAVTPCAFSYRIPAMTLSGSNVPELAWPSRTMANSLPCVWIAPQLVIGTKRYGARLTVSPGGGLQLVLTLREGILRQCVGTYTAQGPVDMTQPFNLANVTSGAFQVIGPASITVTPVPDEVLGSDVCTGITTDAGTFILVT